MADSFILTDGTTSIELKYDPGTQDAYRITYGTRVQQMMPDVLVHEPDDGESLPVRAVDRDRQIFTELQVVADTWDEVLNKVTELRRLLDQGLRYWIDGDVDRVTFRIQLDGATRYTDWPVKWGFIDDSASYYTTAQNKLAWDLVIGMTVSPYGEGAAITLRNDLASSPHFIEDSNADGLADGWNLTAAPTPTISTTYYLVGGQSQKITTDASTGQALFSDSVTVATTTDLVAYIWVYAAASGNDPLTVRLYDGSNNVVESKTFNPASPTGYDKTATGASGETWYRYSFISTATRTAANAYIAVLRSGGTQVTEFYADAAYMETSQDTVPAAWSSTASIENRYDPVAGDEARINYIDVWGVPGDAPAKMEQLLSGLDGELYRINRIRGGKVTATAATLWFEDDDIAINTSVATNWTQTTIADGTATAGEYTRCATPASPLSASDSNFSYLNVNLNSGQYRVYARARVNNINNQLRLLQRGEYPLPATNDGFVSLSAINTWEIVELGTWQVGASPTEKIRIALWADDFSRQIDIDYIQLVPSDSGGMMIFSSLDADGNISTSATISPVTYDILNEDYAPLSYLGELFTVDPGATTRLIYAATDEDGTFDLNWGVGVTLTVTPRTRHLLGTV